jgi:hypothetical protein
MDSPRNDMERLLMELAEGRMEPEDFAKQLLGQQVFMPVQDEKHQIAGFQLSTKAQPLVVEDEGGNRVLVTFSAPERAKVLAADYPNYSGGLLTEVSWILRRMGADMGLSINPGMEPGFDFDPDMVAMLVGLLPEESE